MASPKTVASRVFKTAATFTPASAWKPFKRGKGMRPAESYRAARRNLKRWRRELRLPIAGVPTTATAGAV